MDKFFRQARFVSMRVDNDDRAYPAYSIFSAALLFIVLLLPTWLLLLIDFMAVFLS
jgi:hypothetical protein